MQVTRQDTVHAALGLVFLASTVGLLWVMFGVLEGVPAVHLGATPGAGQVTLHWSLGEPQNQLNPATYTWQYRRTTLNGDGDACGAQQPRTNAEGANGWQPVTPVTEQALAHYVVMDLAAGSIHAFCVRGTPDQSSPWTYSREVAVAVPLLSTTELERIEERLAALETWHAGPCDLNGDELGFLRFDAGAATLPPSDAELAEQNEAAWMEIRQRMSEKGGERVVVAGYASTDHPTSYNLDLSERRMETVLQDLREIFGTQREFLTVAYGEQHDRVRNPQDEPHDRRVSIRWCRDAD